MDEKIIQRICKKAQIPNLLEALVEKLALPDLQSLLLEVYKQKTQKLTPKYLVEQYKQNRFVQPAKADFIKSLEFDLKAFSLLPKDFETIELSPIAPLGCCSIIASIDQNNALTTIRGSEVCSDCTNVLALESAKRRKQLLQADSSSKQKIKLSTSQRMVRPQYSKEAANFSHFRLLSLTTAGRDIGAFQFEKEALTEHISFYSKLLSQVTQSYKIANISIHLTVFNSVRLDCINQLINQLQKAYPNVSFVLDQGRTTGRKYYEEVGFQIFGKNSSNEELMLADGGFVDWTAKLLSNNKERFLISGLGSERLLSCFSMSD